jgi:hypothetical protein
MSVLKDELFKQFNQTILSKKIKLGENSVMLCVRYAMEIVELSELKGEDQKRMVIELMRELIKLSNVDNDTSDKILFFVNENVLNDIIELVVDATKGNININKLTEQVGNCCFAFLSRK